MRGRRGRRRRELLDDLKERRGYCHLKERALQISKRKANWIGHILRRNCLLQRVIEGKKKRGDISEGKTRKKTRELLDDLKERRG